MERVLLALDEVTRGYGDMRIHYCRLDFAALDGDRCALAGVVLDEGTLRGVTAGLSGRLPEVDFDISRVRILRANATQAVVAANLTGLYAASSFLAEQVSQLLNGCPVEMLMEERNLEPVMARFRDDLKKNPSDANTLYGLAVVQAKMGQLQEAANTITAALRYAPEDPDIMRDAGIIAFEAGKNAEAIQYLRGAYQRSEGDPETVLYLGRAYEQAGDYITALELYKKALAANVADDQLYYGLATSYGQLNNPGESHYYFGTFFKKKSKKDSALFHYRAALNLFPPDSERAREIKQEIENLQKPAVKPESAQAPQGRQGPPSPTGPNRRFPR